MSNERFLQVSYFAVLFISAGLGLVTHGLLRKRFLAVSEASRSRLAIFVRKLFLPGLLLPAILGFCSVSYFSCDVTTYEKVIEKRAYLVMINCDQLEAVLLYLTVAVMFWCVVALALLLTGPRDREGGEPRQLPR